MEWFEKYDVVSDLLCFCVAASKFHSQLMHIRETPPRLRLQEEGGYLKETKPDRQQVGDAKHCYAINCFKQRDNLNRKFGVLSLFLFYLPCVRFTCEVSKLLSDNPHRIPRGVSRSIVILFLATPSDYFLGHISVFLVTQ